MTHKKSISNGSIFRHAPNHQYFEENVFRIIERKRKYLFEIYPYELAEKMMILPGSDTDYRLDSREQFCPPEWLLLGTGTLNKQKFNFINTIEPAAISARYFAAVLAHESLIEDNKISDFLSAIICIHGIPIEPGLIISSFLPQPQKFSVN